MDLKRLDPIEGDDGQKCAFLNSPLDIPRCPNILGSTSKYFEVEVPGRTRLAIFPFFL